MKFEKFTLKKRLTSMLAVDFRRMFTSGLFYLMVGISLVIPILILVMTTMMDGTVSVDPQTGVETVIEGFDNVWQIIGTASNSNAEMSMGITSMCNINMMFFAIAVFVCIFIADDFRSGYAKNLFTIRAKKSDYIISKSLIGFIAGAVMLIAFFVGALLGGAFSGLSFDLGGVTISNVIMSMLSKIFVSAIFVSIFVLASVFAKQKLWLSILLSLGIGMLFFMMVPMITPLDSTFINVILCLVGGALFSIGIGVTSNIVLKKTNII